MSCPADCLTVLPSLGTDDAHDALALAVGHARHTVAMIEMALTDAADEGSMLIAPAVLAGALSGVETHLAVIDVLVERVLRGGSE